MFQKPLEMILQPDMMTYSMKTAQTMNIQEFEKEKTA